MVPQNVWQALLAPLIVGVVLLGTESLLSEGEEPSPKPNPGSEAGMLPPQPKPRPAGPLAVRNPDAESEVVKGASRQTKASLPRIEVTVHNQGSRRTVLHTARFSIVDGGTLEDCVGFLGAPLSVSAIYDVKLPVPPKVGADVEVPISQQLGPDEADRFAFRFGHPSLGTFFPGAYLYLLRITLARDQGGSFRMGHALIALPGLPSSAAVGPGRDADYQCVARNRTLARRLLRTRPATGDELGAILAGIVR